MTALPPHLWCQSPEILGAGNAPEGWPRNLTSPRTVGPSRGVLYPRSAFVFLSEAWPLGPLSLPAVSALPQERLTVSLPLECRGFPEMAGQGRRGLAALRDDAGEWGESGQLPEGEQASWALESQAGLQCRLRERKARGNTSIESLLPGAQAVLVSFRMVSPLTLTMIFWVEFDDSHLTDEETEAQRG